MFHSDRSSVLDLVVPVPQRPKRTARAGRTLRAAGAPGELGALLAAGRNVGSLRTIK